MILMHWVWLSFLASFCFAIVNVLNKFILSKYLQTPIVQIIAHGIVGFIASLIIYVFRGFSELSYNYIFLAALSGIFNLLTVLFYLKATKIEEISRVAPLFFINSLFVLIVALVFLGETFSALKYLGIFLLITGTILISVKDSRPSFGKSFWFIIFAAFASAISAVVTKYLLAFSDFWTIFAYARIGTMIALVPVFCFNLSEIISSTKKLSQKSIGVISTNEILNLMGILFITIASVTGPVTLVKSISSTYPFFVFFIVIILSYFYPQILKEKMKRSILILKFIAITLMFIGIILIT